MRRGSTLDTLDNWLLIIVLAIAALVLLGIIRWIVGTVLFVVQLAVVVAVAVLLVRFFSRRR